MKMRELNLDIQRWATHFSKEELLSNDFFFYSGKKISNTSSAGDYITRVVVKIPNYDFAIPKLSNTSVVYLTKQSYEQTYLSVLYDFISEYRYEIIGVIAIGTLYYVHNKVIFIPKFALENPNLLEDNLGEVDLANVISPDLPHNDPTTLDSTSMSTTNLIPQHTQNLLTSNENFQDNMMIDSENTLTTITNEDNNIKDDINRNSLGVQSTSIKNEIESTLIYEDYFPNNNNNETNSDSGSEDYVIIENSSNIQDEENSESYVEVNNPIGEIQILDEDYI